MRRTLRVITLGIIGGAICSVVLYAAASYPSAVKSFSTKTTGQTIAASFINDLQDEVVAIETGILNGFAHNLKPLSANTYDLGTTSLPWGNVYTSGLPMDIGTCEGRITLTTAVPVTTADVTAAATVYFTPYKGNRCALYDGTNWALYTFTELSLALGADTTGFNYDLWLYSNAGTLTLERLVWTNDTTRATALALQNGVYVKTGATTRRYLGTYRTTGAGQTEDSFAKRFVWNYYNRQPRVMRAIDTTNTWNYSTATIRQANASTANQLAFVIGVAEEEVDAAVRAAASHDAAGASVAVGIGEDSTTTFDTNCLRGSVTSPASGYSMNLSALLKKYPAVGYHYWAWLELGSGGVTDGWIGDNGGTSFQSGIHGTIRG